jgi:hypothetical protein
VSERDMEQDRALLVQLAAVLQKLEQARQLPGRDEEFGVAKQRFRPNAPLNEAAIGAFEERHGVRCPPITACSFCTRATAGWALTMAWTRSLDGPMASRRRRRRLAFWPHRVL